MAEVRNSVSSLERILSNNLFGSKGISHEKVQTVESGPFSGKFRYGLATARKEMIAHFALRFQSYREQGYLHPAYAFDEDLEFDEHDINAALFIVRNIDSGKLHGAGRIVFDNGRLPMDDYFSLDEYRRAIGEKAKLVEFSRLVSYPVHQKELNRKLVRFILEFAVSQGATHFVGFGRYDIRHYYERWGFKSMTEPVVCIDLSHSNGPLIPPMPFYPHAMKVADIRWDCI